jgi:hypothetical protein
MPWYNVRHNNNLEGQSKRWFYCNICQRNITKPIGGASSASEAELLAIDRHGDTHADMSRWPEEWSAAYVRWTLQRMSDRPDL